MNNGSLCIDAAGNFSTEILQKGNLFYVICKKLSLVESDVSLGLAYDKLEKRRSIVLNEMKTLGIDVDLSRGLQSDQNSKGYLHKIMQLSVIFFCLSLPIGSAVGILAVAKFSNSIMARAQAKVKNTLSAYMSNPAQLSNALTGFANKVDNITPERKYEMQLALRKIVKFSKPMVNEIQELTE